MPRRDPLHGRILPIFWVFFLPVALVILLAVAFNRLALQGVQDTFDRGQLQQQQYQHKLVGTESFNTELASIQESVGDALQQAAQGKLDQGDVYLIHSTVVNRLAALEQPLHQIVEDSGERQTELEKHFSDYRNNVLTATDIAAIDPHGAMRFAFLASHSYVTLTRHTHAISANLAASAARHGSQGAAAFEALALRIEEFNTGLMLLLLAAWFIITRRMTFRLGRISQSLNALANGDIEPASMATVREISASPRSALRGLAVSVLAFRAAVVAREKAQYELAERIKEITCLFEVTRTTERTDISVDVMLESVARRIPSAMRFPELCTAYIVYMGKQYGTPATGESISVEFDSSSAPDNRVVTVYTASLPPGSGDAFLDEEKALLDAIGLRLGSVL